MKIRKEEIADYHDVFELIENAFKDEPYTDHKEQFLVERLRKSASFVPELSLVAEIDGEITGYILLSRIKIINTGIQKTALGLAPVAVLKKHQGQGIGGKLILEAHRKAKELGFDVVILLGHDQYYPRFGYKMTKNYGIKLPFDVPDENCMLVELTENALKGITGIVEYPKEFYG